MSHVVFTHSPYMAACVSGPLPALTSYIPYLWMAITGSLITHRMTRSTGVRPSPLTSHHSIRVHRVPVCSLLFMNMFIELIKI